MVAAGRTIRHYKITEKLDEMEGVLPASLSNRSRTPQHRATNQVVPLAWNHSRRTVRQGSANVTPMTVDEDLVKAKELLKEARRLLVEEKTKECLGLLDETLARVERVISQLAQRGQPK